jgi:predicted DNA-binding protein (MmcQ/YjbR family)
MNIEEFRSICLSFKHVSEELPFDDDTLVFKVHGKMFALISIKERSSFTVKCEPEMAIELRERYPCVRAAFHMNKQHWNSIEMSGCMDDESLIHWIKESYKLVYDKLPKRLKGG